MTKVRTVMFDLDDTLFDHIHASTSTLRSIVSGHPALASRPPEHVEEKFHQLLEETWIKVLDGSMTVGEARTERFRRLFEWCGETISHARAEQLASRYRNEYQGFRQPVPGARELLECLAPHVSIGIVTNNFVEEQKDKLRCCGLDSFIDYLVTSEEVGVPKPARQMFDAALERAGCNASEAVLVGDNWLSDILGATAVGIRTVWFNRTGRPCPDPALTTEIHSLLPADTLARLLLSPP